MAAFRNVKTSFWTDAKVVNEFSPEDKYFFLYLLTNPKTTQLGIYEFVPKIAAFDMGYSVEAIKVLIDRFQNKYDIIRYSDKTGEIAIKNYLHHSIIKGGKPVIDCLKKEESNVKDKSLVVYIVNNIHTIDNLNNSVLEFIDYILTKEYIKDKDKERIVHDTQKCTSDIDKEADELFNQIWKLYPKKRGRGSVSQTQKRKLLKVGYDELSRCVERYIKDKQGTDMQYIKNGSTFFNSGYIDYLDENYLGETVKKEPIDQNKGLDKAVILLEDESNWTEYAADQMKHPYENGWRRNDDNYWVRR